MNIKTPLTLLITSASIMIAGCANTSSQRSSSTSSTPMAGAQLSEVPRLKVTVDCGNCDVKPTVSKLIIEGYNTAAAKSGRKVSESNEANLVIKEYSARSDAARFMAGALAGKDEIKAVVTYQGSNYSVEDYYRNAWQGIDTLAKKIGQMALAKFN
ncbi:MAG: hypothetical protein ACK52H_06830 [Burkholderiales bacterium]|jgi:hypothetical protein